MILAYDTKGKCYLSMKTLLRNLKDAPKSLSILMGVPLVIAFATRFIIAVEIDWGSAVFLVSLFVGSQRLIVIGP